MSIVLCIISFVLSFILTVYTMLKMVSVIQKIIGLSKRMSLVVVLVFYTVVPVLLGILIYITIPNTRMYL